jgi:hypothetical protein
VETPAIFFIALVKRRSAVRFRSRAPRCTRHPDGLPVAFSLAGAKAVERIESVSDTFKGQLDLERHGGHTRRQSFGNVPECQ